MNTSDDVTFSPGDGFAKKLVETEDNASIEVDDILSTQVLSWGGLVRGCCIGENKACEDVSRFILNFKI